MIDALSCPEPPSSVISLFSLDSHSDESSDFGTFATSGFSFLHATSISFLQMLKKTKYKVRDSPSDLLLDKHFLC